MVCGYSSVFQVCIGIMIDRGATSGSGVEGVSRPQSSQSGRFLEGCSPVNSTGTILREFYGDGILRGQAKLTIESVTKLNGVRFGRNTCRVTWHPLFHFPPIVAGILRELVIANGQMLEMKG